MPGRDGDLRDPTISIIVVNRGDSGISVTLDALAAACVGHDAEVIVVDASGSRFDVVRQHHQWVTWINFEAPNSHVRTIAQQRNVGVRAAKGQVVVFIDASCQPAPGWLGALTSPVLGGEARIAAGVARSSTGSTLHDTIARRGPVSEFSALNVAIDRTLFDEVGPFDEELGFAEDVDFVWRAGDAGAIAICEPAAVVSHDFGDDRTERRRAYRYGRGRARLYDKHRERIRSIALRDRQVIMVLSLWLAIVVSPIAPWALIVFVYPLVKMRRRRPLASTLYLLCYGAGMIGESVRLSVRRWRS